MDCRPDDPFFQDATTISGGDEMIERCDDPACPGYGQAYVDRGYGYPVCPSQKWRSERFPGSENKPLAPEYQQEASE